MSEGEEGDACACDCVEKDVVAGIACDAFDGPGGGNWGERVDTPGDVCGVVGYAEDAGVCSSGSGHVRGSGLEVVDDMDGEEGGGREELAEEEEETGGVGSGGVGDGDDGAGVEGETATEGSGELGRTDRKRHVDETGSRHDETIHTTERRCLVTLLLVARISTNSPGTPSATPWL